jgi:hypothetical protein
MTKTRVRDVVINRWLWIIWGIVLFLMLRTIWPHFLLYDVAEGYDVLSVIIAPTALSALSPFAAIFCSLPAGEIFPSEYTSGFSRYVLLRMPRKRYIRSILLQTLLLGSVVLSIPYANLFLIAAAKAGPCTAETISAFYGDTVWYDMALRSGGYAVLWGKWLLSALFGCVWALAGLTCSAIFVNRYAAAIIPFVVYQTLWSLLAYSPLNPAYLLNGDGPYWKSMMDIVLLQGGLIFLLLGIAHLLMNRRCRDV